MYKKIFIVLFLVYIAWLFWGLKPESPCNPPECHGDVWPEHLRDSGGWKNPGYRTYEDPPLETYCNQKWDWKKMAYYCDIIPL